MGVDDKQNQYDAQRNNLDDAALRVADMQNSGKHGDNSTAFDLNFNPSSDEYVRSTLGMALGFEILRIYSIK